MGLRFVVGLGGGNSLDLVTAGRHHHIDVSQERVEASSAPALVPAGVADKHIMQLSDAEHRAPEWL